jgi:hypothetical protein
MFENGKMRHVETIPEMEDREIKENDKDCEFNCNIL